MVVSFLSWFWCLQAFLADVKWILHNCVIYNGPTTKLTHVAKVIVKIAQHEVSADIMSFLVFLLIEIVDL